jgi:hypothetical protein
MDQEDGPKALVIWDKIDMGLASECSEYVEIMLILGGCRFDRCSKICS